MASGCTDAETVLMAIRHRGRWIALASIKADRHAGADRPGCMRPGRQCPAPGRDQRLTCQGLRQHKGQKQTTHGVSRLHGLAMPRLQGHVHCASDVRALKETIISDRHVNIYSLLVGFFPRFCSIWLNNAILLNGIPYRVVAKRVAWLD